MKYRAVWLWVLLAGMAVAGGSDEMVELKIKIPPPDIRIWNGPLDLKSPNLEPFRGSKPRNPIFVPVGVKLLSRGKKVTSSDPYPVIGDLSFLTDGEKEHDVATVVELAPRLQWIQVDLGAEYEIYACCVWHKEMAIYRDVICQVSNDPEFKDGVVTVFNNDHDNSAKLGKGKDKEYIETSEGRPFAINGVKARYVRFYSNGNTSNEKNHYTEVDIYGK